MKRIKRPNGFWKKLENCKEDALKYKTRTEWSKRSLLAYDSARRNNWLDMCCNHMVKLGSRYKRLIYAFEFLDKSVYVGLTFNIKKRIWQHQHNENSQVFLYERKTKLKPIFKELTEFLDKDIATKKEAEFIEKYKNEGWKILNKNKAGALGGNSVIWNFENCFDFAKKFNSKSSFKNANSSAYHSARRNGWLDKICQHMNILHLPNGYWTKKRCKSEAIKFKSRMEWKNNSMSSYSSAVKNGWLNLCTKHML